MAETTDKKDERLGRFQLGRRCKHAAVELGPIHEAHHVDTGAPALVMTPGARTSWWPRTAWRVRIHVQLLPPLLALEIEQGPGSGRLLGLLDLLCLVLAAIEAVKHDLRMRTHLTSARLGQRHWPYLPHVLAGSSLLLLTVGLWLSSRTRPMDPPPSTTSTVSAVGIPEGLISQAPHEAEHDPLSPVGVAYPLPSKPFATQAKTPCRTDAGEVEFNGGCWLELASRAPCHKEDAEYQGRCYVPVALRKPPLQSATP